MRILPLVCAALLLGVPADPQTIEFRTSLRCSVESSCRPLVTDAAGNIYIAGGVVDGEPRVAGAVGPQRGIYVGKLKAAGTGFEYFTYLGGSGGPSVMAVDPQGNVYLAGSGSLGDIPLVNAFPSRFGGGDTDGFVLKLDPAGTRILYATHLGGKGNDFIGGIAIDGSGHAYVTGISLSADFPLTAVLSDEKPNGGLGAFVAKLSLDGSRLEYSTLLDGAAGRAIAVDDRGNATVLVQRDFNDFSSYSLLKVDASGTSWIYRKPVGGDSRPTSIAGDARGNVWLTGLTDTWRFVVTPDAAQQEPGGRAYFRIEDGALTDRQDGLKASIVKALATDPRVLSTMYAGTSEGVFKSTDNGRTWVAKNNGLTSLTVAALAVDPQTPTTLYLGTERGKPLFKSEDGAENWFPLDAGLPDDTPILSIAVDPQSPATVYVAGPGILRSSDGGQTWSVVVQRSDAFTTLNSVAVDPNHSEIVYYTSNFLLRAFFFGFSSGGIHRSTDGGQTFTAKAGGEYGVGSVLVDSKTPGAVYATAPSGIFRSTDNGESWTLIDHSPSGFPWFRRLALSPEDPSVLYALLGDGRVLRSEDRGDTFIAVSGQRLIGPQVHTLAVTAGAVLHVGASIGSDAFVRKYDPEGSLVYSSYLGGRNGDEGFKVAVDPAGRVYLTGLTYSADFPITAGTPPERVLSQAAFLTRLEESGALGESILLEGGEREYGIALAFGPEGRVVVGGFGIRGGTTGERFVVRVRPR